MNNTNKYDVAIIGGGLAGLGLAIQLAGQSYSVIVFEKEQYPFHRVCGEYISLESWDFLNTLGVDLAALQVPIIRKLQVSSLRGKLLQQDLPLGGFGLSRFVLDAALASLARQSGAKIAENTRVNDVEFNGEEYTISTSGETYTARIACGSFGKRSNLDIKWKRPFSEAAKNKLNNYIGVKYHIQSNFPDDTIALHTFRQGYCGIVKIEGDKYNLCYLTTAANLQKNGNSIDEMEKNILSQNPHLAELFRTSKRYEPTPVTISQISFDKKTQVEHHILMIGDAAGMITPLCGNGMSMALHASKLASRQVAEFLTGRINREKMEINYIRAWEKQFASRLRMGRYMQRLSLSPGLLNIFIRTGKIFPGLVNQFIRQTHGNSF